MVFGTGNKFDLQKTIDQNGSDIVCFYNEEWHSNSYLLVQDTWESDVWFAFFCDLFDVSSSI